MAKFKLLTVTDIYFVEHDDIVLKIGGQKLPTDIVEYMIQVSGLIAWENRGLFCIIPKPIMQNAWAEFNAVKRGRQIVVHSLRNAGELSWSQGIKISPFLAHTLLAPENEPSETDSAAQSSAENQSINPELQP